MLLCIAVVCIVEITDIETYSFSDDTDTVNDGSVCVVEMTGKCIGDKEDARWPAAAALLAVPASARLGLALVLRHILQRNHSNCYICYHL